MYTFSLPLYFLKIFFKNSCIRLLHFYHLLSRNNSPFFYSDIKKDIGLLVHHSLFLASAYVWIVHLHSIMNYFIPYIRCDIGPDEGEIMPTIWSTPCMDSHSIKFILAVFFRNIYSFAYIFMHVEMFWEINRFSYFSQRIGKPLELKGENIW